MITKKPPYTPLQTQTSKLLDSRQYKSAELLALMELSNLRQLINQDRHELLFTAHGRVWLDLGEVSVDCRALDQAIAGELLEGIDISGEEMFEDWLREERARLSQRINGPSHAGEFASIETQAPIAEFSQRPAIAVLPFHYIPASAEREAAAQGISEDLIDRLSKLRWLPIIARSSSFALTAEQCDPRLAGAALGARLMFGPAVAFWADRLSDQAVHVPPLHSLV